MAVSVSVSVSAIAVIQHIKEESLKLVGVSGFFYGKYKLFY